MRSPVRLAASCVAHVARSYWGFLAVLLVLAGWLVGWVLLDLSATWHRVFDVLATITMLVLIFSLELTQHRDSRAIHLKLDELLRAGEQARTELMQMEERDDEELEALQREFRATRRAADGTASDHPPHQ
jgi:low affinity Fe/Cu permease